MSLMQYSFQSTNTILATDRSVQGEDEQVDGAHVAEDTGSDAADAHVAAATGVDVIANASVNTEAELVAALPAREAEVAAPAGEAEVEDNYLAGAEIAAGDGEIAAGEEEAPDAVLNAQWGELKGAEIRDAVTKAYYTTARWKRNIFYLPSGQAGQTFIEEVTKVIHKFNSDSALAPVALMMVSIMFPLLLQKPSAKSKTADHIKYLDRRLTYWREGRVL